MSARPVETTSVKSRPTRARAGRGWIAVLTALAVAGGVTAVRASAADTESARHPDAVQRSLDGLVRDHQFPAALASVRERDGRVRDYTAGVADLKTKAEVPVNGQVRIASNTKMFTATVVLQLVGEGRIDLDAPVETYLPGVVRGNGFDGNRITVRQLLQHTSGLPDYDEAVLKDVVSTLHVHVEPRELVDVALAQPRPEPGWSYANTNYVLAGLVVQKVTGRPIGEEITNRIINRLGLRETYWPGVGEQRIRGAHPHGYLTPQGSTTPVDVTESDPSGGWAAGQLVGTPRDLNRFMTALLDGTLLAPELLRQMRTTVEAPGFDTVGESRYGLGIATFKLSCGGFAWTHGGLAPGYTTANGVGPDGKAATVVVTALSSTLPAYQRVEAALDTALCE
ncbi:D-alanyl-D-alanine carboxypeptidase [Saccharothrix coeruleofusca]|uniref:serine hydrolase domain-containing protein n=1 Tax=Saccharothrix coeruleofusca TaxID=33919 RepID=UPI001AEA5272|nr:serine hydrolase domain-containing protein [Saccharothrix coeruleofusca]MBP2335844.1 D-alanyl-D-alanine carboxypeptidase [Saccharothrix coeruleofusca]